MGDSGRKGGAWGEPKAGHGGRKASRGGRKACGGIRAAVAVGLLPVALFSCLWLFGKTGVYNDSSQYLAMHIHREPLYPLFLWLLRRVLGESAGIEAARFLQNALAALSVLSVTFCLRKIFCLSDLSTAAVSCLWLSPHLLTPVVSETHLVISNGIMSEALSLPLFYFFVAACLKMLFSPPGGRAGKGRFPRGFWQGLLLALLLSLVRGQFQSAILLWGATAIFTLFSMTAPSLPTAHGRFRRFLRACAVPVLGVALAFFARTMSVRTYQLAFHGAFIDNTYGKVTFLANVIYAADPEDGLRIEDGQARMLYESAYASAWEMGANYRFAPRDLFGRAAHLERWHDEIKFHAIEENWRDYHDLHGPSDYLWENVESDRIASIAAGSVLPVCFGTWLYDYAALTIQGLIRSVSVVHPLLSWYGLALYPTAALLLALCLKRNRNSGAGRLMLFALLCVLANACSAAVMIMCISRYMVYGLPLFYTGLFLTVRELAGALSSGGVEAQ